MANSDVWWVAKIFRGVLAGETSLSKNEWNFGLAESLHFILRLTSTKMMMNPFMIQPFRMPHRHLWRRSFFDDFFNDPFDDFDRMIADVFDEPRPVARPVLKKQTPTFSHQFQRQYDGTTGEKIETEIRQIGDRWVKRITETDGKGVKKENEEFHNLGKEDIEKFEEEWKGLKAAPEATATPLPAPTPAPEEEPHNQTSTDEAVQTILPPPEVNATALPQEAPKPSVKKVVDPVD